MKNLICELLKKEKIEYFGIIPMSEVRIINESLYERSFTDFTPKSIIMLLVPYYAGKFTGRNVSRYAVPRDYHLYFKDLYSRIEAELKAKYPAYSFKGFADHSPIGETYAAAKCGLGVVGDLFQLINEKYGSYTFIGEIFTDFEFETYDLTEVEFCDHCGMCKAACPCKDGCLSDITQRKGELSENEKKMIIESGCFWGCDVCREACPMNSSPVITPIDFFKQELTPCVTTELIEGMSKDEFKARAYSWRGKKTILRNLELEKIK
ncbi:MAG: epoxyqueuosine reductase [Ruminococcaceae bacterium]|nr:epoxyqueuosine reductase [Oscillospiraceae bacterium]